LHAEIGIAISHAPLTLASAVGRSALAQSNLLRLDNQGAGTSAQPVHGRPATWQLSCALMNRLPGQSTCSGLGPVAAHYAARADPADADGDDEDDELLKPHRVEVQGGRPSGKVWKE
jgi:hypothetical protein